MAFEYQNYLKSLLDEAFNILSIEDNITTTKEKHLRSRSYHEAEDEEIIRDKVRPRDFSINKLVAFIDILTSESEKLTNAINAAKHFSGQDFDAMIANNRLKRRVLERYNMMYRYKPKESKQRGVGFKFNDSGEQVQYTYDIEVVTTIDYDRNEIKKRISKLRAEVDDISQQIDVLQLSTKVNYEPTYQIGDTLDDILGED
jgi:hypothetical protein